MNWFYIAIDFLVHFLVGRVIFYALNMNKPSASFEYFESFICFTVVAMLLIGNVIHVTVEDVEKVD